MRKAPCPALLRTVAPAYKRTMSAKTETGKKAGVGKKGNLSWGISESNCFSRRKGKEGLNRESHCGVGRADWGKGGLLL